MSKPNEQKICVEIKNFIKKKKNMKKKKKKFFLCKKKYIKNIYGCF